MIETTLNGKTKDITQDNIEQLKQLFPEIITDDKINFEKLKEILGEEIDDSNERYDFTWNGKHEAVKISQTPSEGTLRPSKEDSKNWDTTENLYIEGDNLEVLKILQKSYYGKVKMIYLDPPYNTGKDFVYEDNFRDNLKNYLEQDENGFNVSSNPETSGRYHTNWLNMMYPRIKIARTLLNEEGVIFISIDDNELKNLKNICDEIFGESNFVCNFVWQSTAGSNTGTDIITVTENILVYVKNKTKIIFNGLDADESSYTNKDEYYERRGKFALDKLDSKRQSSHYSEALNYAITMPDGTKLFPGGTTEKSNEGWNYLWSKSKVEWGIENGFIVFKKKNDKWTVYNKRYYKVDNKDNPIKRTIPFRNIILSNQFTTANGTSEIRKIFGSTVFDYPKPSSFIKYLLKTCVNEDKSAIIMDFFSGSASTAHAIMDLNNDGGNRKFILVQIPEKTTEKSNAYKTGYKNICEIGKERIRKSGDIIIKETKNTDLDTGFKVFKLDSSNLTKWNPDVDNLEDSLIAASDNIVEGRSELDLVYEIMLKYGIELTLPVEEISFDTYNFYSIGMGSLVICLNDHITHDVADDVLKIKEDLSPDVIRVVFKDNGFESDSDKTNVKEILRNNEVDEFITI